MTEADLWRDAQLAFFELMLAHTLWMLARSHRDGPDVIEDEVEAAILHMRSSLASRALSKEGLKTLDIAKIDAVMAKFRTLIFQMTASVRDTSPLH